ncbi:ankyrin-1-like [Chelonus insularis]|uniref:ankyrin-1-like n=1 Tax=Chelonus insularis TaxID=460826 RepID=UPI00158DC63B|nr:ankyrin-1-like [Chelonus insularis]
MFHLPQNDYCFHLYHAIGTGNRVTALRLINNSITVNYSLNGYTPLHWAIYKNADFDIIKLLLDKGANIFTTDHQNNTPLRIAIDYYRTAAALLLIQKGALDGENLSELLVKPAVQNNPYFINMLIDHGMQNEPSISLQCRIRVVFRRGGLEIIDECIPKGFETNLTDNYSANSTNIELLTPLHIACEDDNRNNLRAYLENCVDDFAVNPETQSRIGRTPLLEACHHGNNEAVKVLLENHANPNAMDWFGRTALHFSCERKHKTTSSIIQLLLEHNAYTEAVNWVGRTPLFVACLKGNNEAVKILLENHANPNVRDRNGETALHLICSWESKTNLQIIKLLLKYNADIEAMDDRGWTPLITACSIGNAEVVKCLLEHHANPNVTDWIGQPALHLVCSWESETTPQIIKLLLKYNADIEAVDEQGRTPLFVACKSGNVAAVQCLLENHVNPNATNQHSQTALHYICSAKPGTTLQIIQLLLKHNADTEAMDDRGWTPLFEACSSGNIVAVKVLLGNHANPNVRCWNGRTALHLTSALEPVITLQIMQSLLKHNVDIEAADEEGRTPLIEACIYGNVVAVKVLLDNHANPNVTNHCGQTPLHFICFGETESTLKIIQLLLKHNADIEAVDEEGRTPLFEACNSENIGAVVGLLRYGANINILDQKNRSPLQCAADKILSTSPENSNIYTIIQMLVSHIITLKTVRLNVNTCEFITIRGVKYSAIEGLKSNEVLDDTIDTLDIKCEEEIKKMKMESIGINDMCFYELLTQHIHLIGILMENKKIQDILKSSIYDEKFPLFIGIVRFRLRDARIRYRRYKLQKSAREYFSSEINEGIPHECIDKVLDYLTIVDLNTFIRTFKPSRGESVL